MVATRAQVMESLQKKVEYIEASITTKVEEEINKALGPIHHILKDKYHPGEGNHVDAKIEGEFVHHKSEGYHNSMGVTYILAIGHPRLTCINLSILNWKFGRHKWNNIFNLTICGMVKQNCMWQFFIWTKNAGSGGNGIINATQESQLWICSLKPFVLVLRRNITFWVTSQSLKEGYNMRLHHDIWKIGYLDWGFRGRLLLTCLCCHWCHLL